MHEDDVDGGGEIDPGSEPAGGDPNAGNGGADGADGGPVGIEDIVRDVEAELLGDGGGDGDGADDDGAGAGAGKTALPPTLQLLQSFIDQNYGGDPQKFLEAQYESRAEATALRKRLEALERGKNGDGNTDGDRDLAAELKARREQDENIREIETQVARLDASVKKLEGRNTAIENEAGTVQTELESLNAQLVSAPEDQRYSIERKITRLENRYQLLTSEYQSNNALIDSRANTKVILARDLKRAESDLHARIEREEAEERESLRSHQQANQFFDRAFDDELKLYNVDPHSGRAAVLYNSVKGIVGQWLQKRGDADALDMGGFRDSVRRVLGHFEKEFGIKRRDGNGGAPRGDRPAARPRHMQQRTQLTNGTSRVVSGAGGMPRGDGKPPRNADELLDDPNYVRQRAQRVGEALLRRQQAARGRGGQ